MNSLEDLFYGTDIPAERSISKNPQELILMQKMIDAQDDFIEKLDKSQQKNFENYKETERIYFSLSRLEDFKEGFALGAKIMIEALSR